MKADKTFSLEKNTNESLNSSKNSTQQHQLPSQLAQVKINFNEKIPNFLKELLLKSKYFGCFSWNYRSFKHNFACY